MSDASVGLFGQRSSGFTALPQKAVKCFLGSSVRTELFHSGMSVLPLHRAQGADFAITLTGCAASERGQSRGVLRRRACVSGKPGVRQ